MFYIGKCGGERFWKELVIPDRAGGGSPHRVLRWRRATLRAVRYGRLPPLTLFMQARKRLVLRALFPAKLSRRGNSRLCCGLRRRGVATTVVKDVGWSRSSGFSNILGAREGLKALGEACVTAQCAVVFDGDADGFFGSDEDCEFSGACEGGV